MTGRDLAQADAVGEPCLFCMCFSAGGNGSPEALCIRVEGRMLVYCVTNRGEYFLPCHKRSGAPCGYRG